MKISRKRGRHIAAALVAGITLAAMLAGCGLNGASSSSSSTGPATPKDLTVGMGELASSVDPGVSALATARVALGNVYDRLVKPDFKGGWLPSIATKWSFNADASELAFTLRDDVTFTNGEKLDADTVKYNLDRVLDPANKAFAFATVGAKFTGAKVIDPTHVTFLVKNNDVTAMSALPMLYLVPEKYATEAGMGLGGTGVGSGPMMIKSFAPNDHMTLVPNPHYWGSDKVKNLSSVTYLSIADEAARVAALDSGRADIVFPVSPDIWKGFKSSSTVEPVSGLIGQFQSLLLGKAAQDTPLKDVRVRQAVNYAIDKQLLIDSILGGTTTVPSQVVDKDSASYNSALKPFPYDPKKAKQLLADAGYPNGFEISMESVSGRTPGDKDIASAIVDMLGKVGIKVNWTVLPTTEWLQKFLGGTGAPLFMVNSSLEPSMMPEFYFPQWTSTAFSKVTSDPEYDALVQKMSTTLDDKERAKIVQQLSAMMQEKMPLALLYQVPMLYGVKKDVHGFAGRPDMSFSLQDITIGG